MKPAKLSGLQRFIGSFRYAAAGLRYAIRTQHNFIVHLAIAVVVAVVGIWLELAPAAWTVLLVMIGAVLVTELFNTALEVLVDLVTPDYHPLAKIVKDLGAGAVLLIAITSVIVGLVILGPPLWMKLSALLGL